MKNKRAISTQLNRHVLHAKLAPTCFATMLALGMVMPVHAAVVAGNTDKPTIHTDANGTTIVDINKASAEGISHNVYSEFNVDSHGVILNNSGSASNTQLAGQIDGNANMANGSARVILNEVRSSDPSQLNGMVEVAGQSAQVIIANPSGITCDGCGFINTNHATLTTGTAAFDAKGNVTGLDVSKGQVSITGKGMDTRSVQYADIIARSVKVNAKLQANQLNIITGDNHIDKKGRIQKKYDNSTAPELALDVSSLGSMYANKIFMEGTDTGVGVRLDHTDLTASDTLYIDVDGIVDNTGSHFSGKNAATIIGSRVLNHNGQISSDGMVSVTADEMLDNNHGVISGNMVNLAGKTTINTQGNILGDHSAVVTADTLDNTQGEILSNGEISLQSASYGYNASNGRGVINTEGKIASKGAITADVSSLDNSLGHLESNGVMNVNARALTNNNGLISAGNGMNMLNASVLNNDHGVIQAQGRDSQLQIAGNDLLSNHIGTIHSDGSMSINGALDNISGEVSADNDIFMYGTAYHSDRNSHFQAGHNIDMTVTGTFQNAGMLAAGQDMALTIGSNGWNNNAGPASNSGTLSAKGRLAMQMTGSALENSGSLTADQLDLQLSDLNNSGSISSNNDITLNLNNLLNQQGGNISADHDVNIIASTLKTDAGSKIHAGDVVNLNVMNSFDNGGEISAVRDISMFISGGYGYSPSTAFNSGSLIAGNKFSAQMDRVNLINDGTLSADNGIAIFSNSLTNSGHITSAADIQLNTYNGINNEATGYIVGNHIYTTGYVNNMGVISNTGGESHDNGTHTPDSHNTDNGANIPDSHNTDNGSQVPDDRNQDNGAGTHDYRNNDTDVGTHDFRNTDSDVRNHEFRNSDFVYNGYNLDDNSRMGNDVENPIRY